MSPWFPRSQLINLKIEGHWMWPFHAWLRLKKVFSLARVVLLFHPWRGAVTVRSRAEYIYSYPLIGKREYLLVRELVIGPYGFTHCIDVGEIICLSILHTDLRKIFYHHFYGKSVGERRHHYHLVLCSFSSDTWFRFIWFCRPSICRHPLHFTICRRPSIRTTMWITLECVKHDLPIIFPMDKRLHASSHVLY